MAIEFPYQLDDNVATSHLEKTYTCRLEFVTGPQRTLFECSYQPYFGPRNRQLYLDQVLFTTLCDNEE
jgi:hypothetical protein